MWSLNSIPVLSSFEMSISLSDPLLELVSDTTSSVGFGVAGMVNGTVVVDPAGWIEADITKCLPETDCVLVDCTDDDFVGLFFVSGNTM